MRMTTMARVVRARYGTIKRFAAVIGVSPAKASMICQGRYLANVTPAEVRVIAYALNRDFQDTVGLLAASYREWSGRSIYDNTAVAVGHFPEVTA